MFVLHERKVYSLLIILQRMQVVSETLLYIFVNFKKFNRANKLFINSIKTL